MVKKGRRTQGRPPHAEEKAYIAEWFSRNFKDGKVSHTEYLRALRTDMQGSSFDIAAINEEKLTDCIRSRIRTHRKGGPAYGAGSVRRRLSPLKGQSRMAIQYFKKCR